MKLTLIVKATESCNARCVYCSVADKGRKTTRMGEGTLEMLFRRIAEHLEQGHADEVDIIWHGGEPLLMGSRFYVRAHELQQALLGENARRVHHSFQTNLTLFDDEFAEVFRLLHVKSVGSSIESGEMLRRMGTADDGSRYRELFLHGLRRLDRAGVSAGFIYVVTAPALEKPLDALAFVANLATDRDRSGIRFNRLYLEGEARKGEQAWLAVSGAQYGHFLGALLPSWLRRRRFLPDVEPISALYRDLVEKIPCGGCEDSGSCGTSHLGIDPQGMIYQCGRSMDAGILCFGNLRENDFRDVFEHPSKTLLNRRSERLAETECAACRFSPWCHGGCPVDGCRQTGDFMRKGDICDIKRIFMGEYLEPLAGISIEQHPPHRVDGAGVPS